jgi:hypothetical protein
VNREKKAQERAIVNRVKLPTTPMLRNREELEKPLQVAVLGASI